MEKTNMPYEPKPAEIASFELFGRRLPDGRVQIGDSVDNEVMDAFPAEVKVCGIVYTLEDIKRNLDEDGNVIDNIEWGIYC